MNILHGPANVGNQPWTLSRAERLLGHKSDVVQNYGTWIGYPSDWTLGKYAKGRLRARFVRKAFSWFMPLRYDVVHYYFGRTFSLWDDFGMALGRSQKEDGKALRDAVRAKRKGRRLVMTLQGCDVRIAGVSDHRNAVTMCRAGACSAYETCVASLDASRRAMISTVLPLMDRVFFLNPELGHMMPSPAEFLPYANVDVMNETMSLPNPGRRLRIVHAPSNGGIKGTPLVLGALERLKEHYDFELILVENTPHAEAMKIYRSADLAIDQVLLGWYGGFSVEMMAMGKPVAVYIRDEDRQFVPPAMWDELPFLRIDPRTLDDDLARILSRPEALVEAGLRSRRFVERWHDPLKIARALTAIYRDPKASLVLGE